MDYFTRFLVLAVACFLYGSLRLLFPGIPDAALKQIKDTHKRTYSRICGVALLTEGFLLSVLWGLERHDMLYDMKRHPIFLLLYVSFCLIPVGALIFFKRKYRKTI